MGKHHTNTDGTYRDVTLPRELIPRTVRKWLYNVVLAGLPLLTAIGVISDELTPAIIGFAGALLAVGTARGYLAPAAEEYSE